MASSLLQDTKWAKFEIEQLCKLTREQLRNRIADLLDFIEGADIDFKVPIVSKEGIVLLESDPDADAALIALTSLVQGPGSFFTTNKKALAKGSRRGGSD